MFSNALINTILLTIDFSGQGCTILQQLAPQYCRGITGFAFADRFKNSPLPYAADEHRYFNFKAQNKIQ
jgi:hypothetical protein